VAIVAGGEDVLADEGHVVDRAAVVGQRAVEGDGLVRAASGLEDGIGDCDCAGRIRRRTELRAGTCRGLASDRHPR
jgi:hypothetical protein